MSVHAASPADLGGPSSARPSDPAPFGGHGRAAGVLTPLHLTLVEPQIPHNTGAIARLCVCLGARLHLIRPLGFSLRESRLKRAALDYWEHADVAIHADWESYLAATAPAALFFLSTRGTRAHTDCRFTAGAHLVFGNETAGLPAPFYTRYAENLFRIPMPGPHARSLNLATAAAIAAYEAHRQLIPPPPCTQS